MSADLLAAFLKEASSGDEFEDLKHSVLRNIKCLLESRQSLEGTDTTILSGSSLYGYGLSGRNLGRSDYQSNRLCREIEQMLLQFEPRLIEVLVEVEKIRERGNRLAIRIEGLLQSSVHHPVSVVFDSVLNMTCCHLSIEESRFA